MIELKHGVRTIDLPYTIRLYGVREEMFDELGPGSIAGNKATHWRQMRPTPPLCWGDGESGSNSRF
jgi:hypothetical protein